jgi:FAD/FMN-containing dehydrogenase
VAKRPADLYSQLMASTVDRWTNWVGNQSFAPARRETPASADEASAIVRAAVATGQPVRVAAAGHSITSICQTDGLLLDVRSLSGIVAVDQARHRVRVLPGTTVGAFGDPLWAEGLALANQGDIDTQQIAGAVGTGTHGSGIAFPSFSATLRGVRIATGTGDVIEIGEDRPELLRAAQVSVGMLGVMLELELEVAAAYRLRERIEHRPYADVIEQWDSQIASHRHFSFFWLPSERSGELYGLATPDGVRMTDTCYVKLYDEAGDDEPDDATAGRRVDRSYRIYPAVFEANHHELEYFVPVERGKEAVGAMRELMLARLPDSVFPMEVRTTAGDEAYLSSNQGGASAVISVSGVPGTDYWPYLREVDALLGDFGARVHWGKLHFLTRAQLADRYPESERFIAIRRELDPQGLFLNDHLRELFA